MINILLPLRYRKTGHPRWKFATTSTYVVGLTREVSLPDTMLEYCSFMHSILTLEPEYFWDGATKAIDDPTIIEPSAVHDALYQLLLENYPFGSAEFKAARKQIDKVFKKMLWENCKRYISLKTIRSSSRFSVLFPALLPLYWVRCQYVYWAVRYLYPLWKEYVAWS